MFPSNEEAVTETLVKPESLVREFADPVNGLPAPAKPDRSTECMMFHLVQTFKVPVSAFPKASLEKAMRPFVTDSAT